MEQAQFGVLEIDWFIASLQPMRWIKVPGGRSRARRGRTYSATRFPCQPLRECIFWTTDVERPNKRIGQHCGVRIGASRGRSSSTSRAETCSAYRALRWPSDHPSLSSSCRIPQVRIPERHTAQWCSDRVLRFVTRSGPWYCILRCFCGKTNYRFVM